jgi:hypothetical protein
VNSFFVVFFISTCIPPSRKSCSRGCPSWDIHCTRTRQSKPELSKEQMTSHRLKSLYRETVTIGRKAQATSALARCHKALPLWDRASVAGMDNPRHRRRFRNEHTRDSHRSAYMQCERMPNQGIFMSCCHATTCLTSNNGIHQLASNNLSIVVNKTADPGVVWQLAPAN